MNREGAPLVTPFPQAGNMPPAGYSELSCAECAAGANLDFDFTMAYQPIVNVETRTVFAHEALVRGQNQEPAAQVLAQVNAGNRYRFDQACRVKGIRLASALDMQGSLSLNFMPNAVYQPESCIRTSLAAAAEAQMPLDQIIFEVTEGERVEDHEHLRDIIREYQRLGFKTAIDDFGAGFSGLNLLAEFQPDYLKLDMALTRGIHLDRVRQAIVRGILQVATDLFIEPIAEGIETRQEAVALCNIGIRLMQGFYFGRPAFQSLTAVPVEAFDGL